MTVETPTPQDATLWCFQTEEAPMQLGAVCVFEGAPMRDADGALRVEELRHRLAARLVAVPRLRSRLVASPLGQGLLLADDPDFDIARHVRVTALARPGSDRQLQELTAALLEGTLTTGRPLWELWLVDGLQGDRVALLVRVSHVLADGIALSRLVLSLLDAEPGSVEIDVLDDAVRAASLPGRVTLLGTAVGGRVRRTAGAARGLARAATRPADLVAGASTLVRAGAAMLPLAAPLPITAAVGARRAVAWTALPLAALTEVKRAEQVTLNDVVLAVVGGAVDRYLGRHGVDASTLRVVVPVGAPRAGPEGQLENRFSLLFVDVPLGVPDPLLRLRQVSAQAWRRKGSDQGRAAPVLFGLGGVVPPWLLRRLGPALLRHQPFAHLVVTNIRGTAEPRYLLGGRMLAAYPLVGVIANMAVIVGVASYQDTLGVGVTVDADVMPDVAAFVDDLAAAAAALVDAARADLPRTEVTRAPVV